MVHHGFRQSLERLGAAHGRPIDKMEASAETAYANKPIQVPAEGGGIIQPGTLAAERVTRKAMHIFSTGSPIEPAFTSCPDSKRVCAIVTSY